MAFIAQYGGELKEGKTRAFIEWLESNEKELANAHPEGSRYIGTYFAIFSSEKSGGSVHTFVEMENYGTMDVLAEAGKGDGVYAKLLSEMGTYFDQGSSDYTNALYKKATAVTYWGD